MKFEAIETPGKDYMAITATRRDCRLNYVAASFSLLRGTIFAARSHSGDGQK